MERNARHRELIKRAAAARAKLISPAASFVPLRALAVFALSAGTLSACSEPLVFSDWTIDVPEGTRILEHAGVPLAERGGEPIRMERDLEIGRNSEDPDYTFYRAWSLAVDDEGRMYVCNNGTSEVFVYDDDGRFVRRFGREGQGPGEFGEIYEATFAAGKLTVEDEGNNRLSMWDTDGNNLGEIPTFARSFGITRGLDDGSYVGAYTEFFRDETPPRGERWLVHVSTEGEPIARITELPQLGDETGIEVPHPAAWPTAARDGSVYMTPGAEYEVFSFALDGTMKWALRSTWTRTPITQEIIDGVQPYIESIPEPQRPTPEWPETMPALRFVWVDGHGHVYVVPYTYVNETLMLSTVTSNPIWADLGPMPPAPELLPVDVYSPDGELLFAGMIESAGQHTLGWQDARGDHVYRRSTDWDTGETFLERLRLIEPF